MLFSHADIQRKSINRHHFISRSHIALQDRRVDCFVAGCIYVSVLLNQSSLLSHIRKTPYTQHTVVTDIRGLFIDHTALYLRQGPLFDLHLQKRELMSPRHNFTCINKCTSAMSLWLQNFSLYQKCRPSSNTSFTASIAFTESSVIDSCSFSILTSSSGRFLLIRLLNLLLGIGLYVVIQTSARHTLAWKR